MQPETPEELARLVKQQPMRRIVTLVCSACRYEWGQPSMIGKCPRCHSASTQPVAQRISAYRTV